MNYGALRNHVESALGRTDFPDYVYTLTTSGVNRDCRFLDMEKSTTIDTSANPQDLPSDFHSVISAYILTNGDKHVLQAVRDRAAHLNDFTRIPRFYSIRDGKMYFAPEPDGTYTVYLAVHWRARGSVGLDGHERRDEPLSGALHLSGPHARRDMGKGRRRPPNLR